MGALRVAYVEDNQSNVIPLLRKLRETGLGVEHFYTLGGAMNRVTEGLIDAVVVSIDAPGFQRSESIDLFATKFPTVPLIVMAARSEVPGIRNELGTAVTDYFIKDRASIEDLAQLVAERVE